MSFWRLWVSKESLIPCYCVECGSWDTIGLVVFMLEKKQKYSNGKNLDHWDPRTDIQRVPESFHMLNHYRSRLIHNYFNYYWFRFSSIQDPSKKNWVSKQLSFCHDQKRNSNRFEDSNMVRYQYRTWDKDAMLSSTWLLIVGQGRCNQENLRHISIAFFPFLAWRFSQDGRAQILLERHF